MDLYVGIDVACEKHNCCIIDEKERVLFEFSFSNDQAGFDNLLHYLQHPSFPIDAKRYIGLEATGVYGENLTVFLRRNGFEVTTFNPLSVKKQLTATTLRKTKTDKSDAKFLAVMLARGNYEPDAPTLYHISELKSLSRRRFLLVKKRSGAKNVAKSLITKLFPEYCLIRSQPSSSRQDATQSLVLTPRTRTRRTRFTRFKLRDFAVCEDGKGDFAVCGRRQELCP